MGSKHIFLIVFVIISSLRIRAEITDDLPGATIGYTIIDLNTGCEISAMNPDLLLIPASTQKVLTGAAAIKKLTPHFRFKTEIFSTGVSLNDTLYGDLIICGNGDPTLGQALIDTIISAGFVHVQGTFKSNALPYVYGSWMVEDICSDYGVGWSPLNYRLNESLINDDLKAYDPSAIENEILSDLTIAGLTFDNKELLASCFDSIRIATIESAPMSDLAHEMMHNSNNLYAEAIGHALADNLREDIARDSLTAFLTNSGIKADWFQLKDFSGLSRTNLITVRGMALLLKAMRTEREFMKLFPINGKDGTVKKLLKGTRLERHFALKSGSMDGILAYAGYKLNAKGEPTHAVVIIVNNCTKKHSFIRKAIEKWFLKNFS